MSQLLSAVTANAAALLAANNGQGNTTARVYDRPVLAAGRIRPKVDTNGRVLGNISDGARPGELPGHYVCTAENNHIYMCDPTELLARAQFTNTLQLQGQQLRSAQLSVIHGVLMKVGFDPTSARWTDITDIRSEALAANTAAVVNAGY